MDVGVHPRHGDAQCHKLLPVHAGQLSPLDEALYAFLAEKGRRSGCRRTVEGYARVLWRRCAMAVVVT